MKTSEVTESLIRQLIDSKKLSYTKRWQAIEVENPVIELTNVFKSMEICKDICSLAEETKADLPWAEDHFVERISGPTNPGVQYKNWPYYRPDLDNGRFRPDGLFSHTYQERFWPPKKEGVRFTMGDWNDVVDRISEDLSTRQCFLSIWHPEDQSNNKVRLPCTIGYWFKVIDDHLDCTYLIRSCDARRHFRNDIYMTQRLVFEMISRLKSLGLSINPGLLHIWIGSFHCFQSDLYYLKKTNKTCADSL